jgi:ribosome-binding protein aMBF1 (putative translation factor)
MAFLDFLNKKCVICKRKVKPLRKYVNDQEKIIKVCKPCSEYAERRAYRLKK